MDDQLGNSLRLGIPIGGTRESLTLSPEDRAKHLYVVGASGAGKSKFLEGLVRQDIEAWAGSRSGLLLIDPDGTIFDGLMDWLATSYFLEQRPVIPIDFRQDDWVVSYNPLRQRAGVEASVVVNNFVSAVAHVWGDESVEKTPLFARYAKSLVQALYERGASVPDAVFFLDFAERSMREAMIRQIKDGDSRAAWEYVQQLKPDHRFMDELGSTVRRLHPFTYNRLLRASLGSPKDSLDIMAALEEGHIVLLCLAQQGGKIDQTDAKLYATTLLADLWQTAQQRGKGDAVKPFYVYIDEFQEYLTPTIATTLARARGYGLHFTLAHQFPSQVIEFGGIGKRIFDSIIANADTIVAFRQRHPDDVEMLAKLLFMGTFDPYAIKRELYATKVVDYERVILRATSESSGSGSGGSDQTSESELIDEDGNAVPFGSSTGSGSTWSSTASSSSTDHEAFRPVLGQELSSMESLSLEDQRFLAVAAIQTQGDRHAVARVAGHKEPTTFRTDEVRGSGVGKHWAEEYRAQLLQDLQIALPFEQALDQLEQRQKSLREELVTRRQDDDAPAKRRIKPP